MTREEALAILERNFQKASKYDTYRSRDIYIDITNNLLGGFIISTWRENKREIHDYCDKPWMNLSIL